MSGTRGRKGSAGVIEMSAGEQQLSASAPASPAQDGVVGEEEGFVDTSAYEGHKLLDHLVVVGLTQSDLEANAAYKKAIASRSSDRDIVTSLNQAIGQEKFPPKILFTYPYQKSVVNSHQIPDFCFPTGVTAKVIRRTDSGSSMNQILYGQSYRNNSSQLHIFFLGGEGNKRLYGLCISKMEFVDALPSFISPKKTHGRTHSDAQYSKMHGRNRWHVVAPRCYCILTYVPTFRLHFELLFSLLGQEQLGRLKGMEVFSQKEEERERKRGGSSLDGRPRKKEGGDIRSVLSSVDLRSYTGTQEQNGDVPPPATRSTESLAGKLPARGFMSSSVPPPTPSSSSGSVLRDESPAPSPRGENNRITPPPRVTKGESVKVIPPATNIQVTQHGTPHHPGIAAVAEGEGSGHRRTRSLGTGFMSWLSEKKNMFYENASALSPTNSPRGEQDGTSAAERATGPPRVSDANSKRAVELKTGEADVPVGDPPSSLDVPRKKKDSQTGLLRPASSPDLSSLSTPPVGEVEDIVVGQGAEEEKEKKEKAGTVKTKEGEKRNRVGEVKKESRSEITRSVDDVVCDVVAKSIHEALTSEGRVQCDWLQGEVTTDSSQTSVGQSTSSSTITKLGTDVPAGAEKISKHAEKNEDEGGEVGQGEAEYEYKEKKMKEEEREGEGKTEGETQATENEKLGEKMVEDIPQTVLIDSRSLYDLDDGDIVSKASPLDPSANVASSLFSPSPNRRDAKIDESGLMLSLERSEQSGESEEESSSEEEEDGEDEGASRQTKKKGKKKVQAKDGMCSTEIRQMLQAYMGVNTPAPAVSFILPMPEGIADISFKCPYIRPELRPYLDGESTLITDWCVLTTLRTLSLNNILLLFSAVLLEKQILFVSPNLGLLSTVAMSMIAMMRPLHWQGLYAPVLPGRMMDLLDAPVPFIFGVHSLPKRRVADGSLWDRSNWDGMTVDLDNNNIKLPGGLYRLPEGKKLLDKLKSKCGHMYSPQASHHPSNITHREMQTVNDLIACFVQYTTWFSTTITNSVINSFKQTFGPEYSSIAFRSEMDSHEKYKELKRLAIANFLKKISYQNRPFVSHFIDTQMFAVQFEKMKK